MTRTDEQPENREFLWQAITNKGINSRDVLSTQASSSSSSTSTTETSITSTSTSTSTLCALQVHIKFATANVRKHWPFSCTTLMLKK